jgi:pimeloyl-ACP methyl ester carboxylesterase
MEAVRTLEVHGHVRAVRVLGAGSTALLLVHGIGSDGSTWDRVAPRLAENHTVIVPDLLGHGRSAKPRADYSIGGYANGMRDLLGILGIERVTVVGHSFGGGVAMQFAYQFPERTDRLVLVGCGGLGRQVSVALKALTVPGASLVVGLSHLAPVRLAGPALRAAARIGVPASLAADLGEALTVHASLRDPAARAAFLHVLRHVVDWRGQLITMARPGLPDRGTADFDRLGRGRPRGPGRARPQGLRPDAQIADGHLPRRRSLPAPGGAGRVPRRGAGFHRFHDTVALGRSAMAPGVARPYHRSAAVYRSTCGGRAGHLTVPVYLLWIFHSSLDCPFWVFHRTWIVYIGFPQSIVGFPQI